MKTVGIIAEYNPFHNGHAYHIQKAKEKLGATHVVVVMSGNFVQRGSFALFDKWTRAEMAVAGGADLVLELPTPYAVSTANRFAESGVRLLLATGVCDALSFGSECDTAEAYSDTADVLESSAFSETLRLYLGKGLSFPAAREAAVETLAGDSAAALLRTPNSTLGLEYVLAIRKYALSLPFLPVRRCDNGYHSMDTEGPFCSATALRELLFDQGPYFASALVPEAVRPLLIKAWEQDRMTDETLVERAVLAALRRMKEEDFAALADVTEGLENRLVAAAKQARSAVEFLELVKNKRVPLSRLRRILLSAFLGISAADTEAEPRYLRVLSFGDKGRELLRTMEKTAVLPVLTKPAEVKELSKEAQDAFQLEERCTDLYMLARPAPGGGGAEMRTSPVYCKNK